MNIGPLNLIKEQAMRFPKQFQMTVWRNRVEEDGDHPCGIVGCIAGHLVNNVHGENSMKNCYDIPESACEILGITKEQGEELFYLDHWPSEFSQVWSDASKNERDRAIALCKCIDAFVKRHSPEPAKVEESPKRELQEA